MASKLDKNSKSPSGKNQESSSAAKPKAKAATERTASSVETRTTKSDKSAVSGSASSAKAEASAPKPKSAAPKAGAKEAPGRPSAAVSKAPASKTMAAKAKSTGSTAPRAASKSGSEEGPGLEEFTIALIKSGETRERIWRTKNFQQMPAQREFGFPDVAPELPGHYNQDKLVLMPKDPEYMFCYWELTPNLVDGKGSEKIPDGNYRETLKINWESKSLFEPNFTFIPVFFWARKWYFGVPQVGQRYQVELGWLSDTGHFISIIRSNLSELPESWAQTQKRLSEQGDVLAYSARNSKVLGSSEHLVVEDSRAFVPEWNLSSESFSSSSWSRAAGDTQAAAANAGSSKPSKKSAEPKARASATARLEISGKVLPGTQVLVGGRTVPTDGLGFFKTEFPYEQDTLSLKLTDRAGSTRSFAYDLKELVLT